MPVAPRTRAVAIATGVMYFCNEMLSVKYAGEVGLQ